jgi:hypothetical protein
VILDGSHKKWCLATGVLFLLATAGYVWYALATPGGPRGGSIVGMLYGIAGSALMLFAGLISLRKKVPTWPIGSAQTWLRGHIWFGLLSGVLILYHAGLHWGGPLEQALLWVTAAVTASGLIDLGVQQLLPRQMTARVPLETFYAQLPFECRLLQVEGDVAVAGVCGPLPVESDQNVATEIRLKGLGVKSRDRHQPLLAVVYRTADSGNGHAPVAEPAAPKREKIAAGVVASPAEQAGPPKVQPSSAAEKIAHMRSLKHATPKPPAAEEKPAEPLAAGDAPTSPEPASPAKLTAAEKIALMRAGKKPAAPAAVPGAAATAEETPVVAPAAGAEKKALSAADKIALMRAGKKPATPAAAEAQTAPAPEHAGATVVSESGEAKKPVSAAEKIALMRAAKKPAAQAGAAPAAEQPKPVDAPAGDEAKTPLSAAEKIALMRKQKGDGSDEKASAPSKPVAKKAVASSAEKVAAKPVDAASQQRAVEGLRKFYIESVRPFLDYSSRARGPLASEVNAGGIFAVVGAGLNDGLRPVLDRLLELCEKRRQLSVQERIHRTLHFWLFVHVPLSLALLGLGLAHAVMSVYY